MFGILAATVTAAISVGDRVSEIAMSGTAMATMPSARFADTVDVHSRQKLAGSPPPNAASRARGWKDDVGGPDTR